jgi:photosystem II stability/assembly factor-like uncharacterized protein
MNKPALILSQFVFYFFLISGIGCQNSHSADHHSNTGSQHTKDQTQLSSHKDSTSGSTAVLFRSDDGGLNWEAYDAGIPADATLSGIKEHDGHIYITTDYHGIFISKGGKNEWNSLGHDFLSGMDINCIELQSGNLIIGTLRSGILHSTDGGLSWQPSTGITSSPVRAFFATKELVYTGTDDGIYTSADAGLTWQHAFGRSQILGFTSLNGQIYAAAQDGAIMQGRHYTDWQYIYEGDALHDVGTDGVHIYAMTIGQELLKTKNDGELWENAQYGIPRPPNYYTNELKHIGSTAFSAQWIGLYRSTDHGDTWQLVEGLPDSTAFSTLEVTSHGILAGISIR